MEHDLSQVPQARVKTFSAAHPTVELTAIGHMEKGKGTRTEVLRTASKLMDGVVFG